jgi:hypothetical protein
MASFVYVRSVDDKNSAAGWKKTSYKKLSKWVAETGAVETPITRRPGLTTFCFKLPDGRLVKAEARDEETVREQCAIEQGINSVNDYVTDDKNPTRWRAKALSEALRHQGIDVV